MKLLRKGALVAAFAASAIVTAAPAQAHGYDRGRGSDDAAIAIGAGILGLAVGAAIASDRDDGYYYRDRRYYAYPRYRGGYYQSYPVYGGYYPQYRRYERRDYYRGDYNRGHDRHGWREHRRGR